MEKLPKDMIVKLAEELSPQDLINFCTSETSSNIFREQKIIQILYMNFKIIGIRK